MCEGRLGVGSTTRWARGGWMPEPGAGIAAASSCMLHSSPLGWYSAPMAMECSPAHVARGSSLKSVEGLPGRKCGLQQALPAAACGLGVGWWDAC